jgi:hypothetical protein
MRMERENGNLFRVHEVQKIQMFINLLQMRTIAVMPRFLAEGTSHARTSACRGSGPGRSDGQPVKWCLIRYRNAYVSLGLIQGRREWRNSRQSSCCATACATSMGSPAWGVWPCRSADTWTAEVSAVKCRELPSVYVWNDSKMEMLIDVVG